MEAHRKRDLTNTKADDNRTVNGLFLSHAKRAKLWNNSYLSVKTTKITSF